ncbi:MAG: TIGR04211 family SH3 domain-containing protein [Gammaproteobacteria bacterium]|nr:TIGR04211 family SH3 domain-containing protein [Gammaproteobacteria bacterium]NNJ84472.1 TIGR04211 family SH3 domain-containing protein [Gammaproteobacteria bacterium]
MIRCNIIRHLIVAGLLGCLPGVVIAETAYVIDRVLVGVYKGKKQTGTTLEVLPTGASVEVLSRDADLARVRTADGVTGWVDANYLIPEKPAHLLLLELEATHEETTIQLRETERKLQALTAEGLSGQMQATSGTGFESLTYKQWAWLMLLFFLVFSLGGYLVRWVIHRRYYLVAR